MIDPGDLGSLFTCPRCGEEGDYGDASHCPLCGESFCSEECYNGHLRTDHPKEWNERIDWIIRNGG